MNNITPRKYEIILESGEKIKALAYDVNDALLSSAIDFVYRNPEVEMTRIKSVSAFNDPEELSEAISEITGFLKTSLSGKK